MGTIAPLIAAWDEGHREYAIALEGLSSSDLWTRAHPRLLSVGELTGHVAYWQTVWILGNGDDRPDLNALTIQSPLIDHAFRYYTSNIEQPFWLDLDVRQTLEELMKVHEFARESASSKEIDEPCPGQWGTWGNIIQYQAFHVAYHTGQVYSVRHLMGHETEDN